MNEALLFLTCIAAGGLLRIVYVLERTLARSTFLIPVTIILDFIFGAVTVMLLWAIIYFLSGGLFKIYLPFGMLAGFLLLSIFISSPKVEFARRKKAPSPAPTKRLKRTKKSSKTT